MSEASSMSEQERLRELYRTETDMDPYNMARYETVQKSTGEPTYKSFTTTVTTEPLYAERTYGEQQPKQVRISPDYNVSYGGRSSEEYTGSRSQITESRSMASSFFLSDKIINATTPLEVNETEMRTVNQQSGIYVNKQDEMGWNGQLNISQYPINVDSNPEVILKTSLETLEYVQPVTIKYLKPPSPQPAGDIVIKREKDTLLPRAPPLIIRQRPQMPATAETVVYREQPPQIAAALEQKIITISGKKLPPPPRRLIIEKLPVLPAKPQPIVIEKWLQQERQTRRVKFIQAERVEGHKAEKNLIIKWDSPRVRISKDIQLLGTQRCDPLEYRRQFESSLLSTSQMMSVLNENKITLTQGLEQTVSLVPKLEGDLEALAMIDLDRYGLSEYKSQLTMYTSSSTSYQSQQMSSSSGGGYIETYMPEPMIQ